MRRDKRVVRAALALAGQGRAEPFHSIELVAVGRDRAQGRPPGLYRWGATRPAVGLLVYDPARGDPVVPAGRLAPWGLVIECHVADEES
ncbi:hypothetical protein J8F10_05815 [Gemmata sp. G18]|uniref:Uncharacterized protein n=1 Tax=Gemmata palustris TaxID=2822762 RepID=A0ABS5BM70_9BACT|nr:hypothetical protein [Gemmata palustris]MBP3954797.1 hypothetical protein [Gemmata palustris]